MKATDLRIGNYVLIPAHSDRSKPLVPCIEKKVKGITRFSELDFTEVSYPEPHLVNINHCAGVLLTEEWLLKFGFYKNDVYIKYGNGADWQPKYPRTSYTSYNIEVECDTYFAFVFINNEWIKDNEVVSDKTRDIVFGSFYPTQVDSSDFLNIELKYVHQLQNLYFALTGKELKTETNDKKD